MTLVEFNDKLLVNKDHHPITIVQFTQNDIDEFRRLIAVNPIVKNCYDSCEDSNAFLEFAPWLKTIYGKDLYTELFYAAKMTSYYKGIPCRLIYILNTMFSKFGTQHLNDTLSRGYKYLIPYLNYIFDVDGQEVTLKGLIDNYAGRVTKLLTKTVRKVKSADCYEVYVNGEDRVALIPNDIANTLPYDMCAKLAFAKSRGLYIDDIIIRTMNGRIGVTKDDFDLRKCL